MKIRIPDFTKAHVLIVGDVMLDRYWRGQTARISPEAPVPVVRVTETDERPGGAGNVALNVAALSARVTLMGITGDDAAAESLAAQLTQAGVAVNFERYAEHSTIVKLRVLSRHQQLMRLDFEEDFLRCDTEILYQKAERVLKDGANVLILSDYGKGTLTHAKRFINLAKQYQVPVLVDPKTKDFSLYHGATLITPNFEEFQQAVGACVTENDILEKGRALMRAHAISALLVTRGEQGMTLFVGDHPAVHLPARAHEVFDVTGAGDTVIGVLAAALASGQSFVEAMALSNLAAGISVTKLGAATVSVPELQVELSDHHDAAEVGIVNEAQLLLWVAAAKKRGERIVMTNGCFDILHPGHVAYLQQAKALGDRLIVAVNADASVTRLKGKGRPINGLEHRMAVLAGLGAIDWVVPFVEDTPARLIAAVLPDVLVKGGDYKIKDIAGHEVVLAQGGEVKILNFLAGHSTTALLKRMQKNKES